MIDSTIMLITFIVLLILFYPSYHYAKVKNLSIGWNLFWTIFFGPLWWIILMTRRKKEYQVFKYKKKAIIE